jgi:hypothetical protein
MPQPWNPFGLPGCAYCRHNRDDGTCNAYPAGIPLPISGGDIAHTRPLPGDNGIQFDPVRDPAIPASVYELAAVDE